MTGKMRAGLVSGLPAFFVCLFLLAGQIRAESVGEMVESFGESIGQGLENLGEQLNRANESFFNSAGRPDASGYEAQMRQYRQLEAARVNGLAEMTGVSPDVIRKLRSDGLTWQQIADKYGVSLESLPPPQPDANPVYEPAN